MPTYTNHLSENDFFVQLLLFLPNSEAFIPLLGCSCLSGRFTEACPCWYLYQSVVRTCSGFYSEPLANGAEKQNPTAKATLTVYADRAPWWTALPFNLLTPHGSMEKVIRSRSLITALAVILNLTRSVSSQPLVGFSFLLWKLLSVKSSPSLYHRA